MRALYRNLLLLLSLVCYSNSHHVPATSKSGADSPVPLYHFYKLPYHSDRFYGKHSISYIKYKLALLESSNNYFAVNKRGYLGKYQFHVKTLHMLGYKPYHIKMFLKSPELQEEAMEKLLQYNYRLIVKHNLDKYVDTEINGIKINMAGMLAVCHLLGFGSLKSWINSNGKCIKGQYCQDGNGTHLQKYLKLFNDDILQING